VSEKLVLDSFALVSLFHKEPGWEKVRAALYEQQRAGTKAFLKEAQQIFLTYGRDHRLSFCDAVTFVVVTTLLDHVPCFAFDEDFRSLGLQMIGNR
jgi:predicted nucleic acid-binding protein